MGWVGDVWSMEQVEEAKEHHPKVVFVDADNHIARVTNYEKHGKLTDDFIGA